MLSLVLSAHQNSECYQQLEVRLQLCVHPLRFPLIVICITRVYYIIHVYIAPDSIIMVLLLGAAGCLEHLWNVHMLALCLLKILTVVQHTQPSANPA